MVSRDDTKDFGKHQENRQINHGHLQKIKKQFLSSFEIIPAVIINIITNHIIDGQHRLQAFQDLVDEGLLPPDSKIKVMWVEIPVSEEKLHIIEANCNTKNWSLDDYISSYVKAGIQSYVKLDEWCKAHPLSSDEGKAKYRYGAAIIAGKRCNTVLKDGTFTFTDDEISKADEIHAEMLEIVEVFGLNGKGNWIESLATSWSSVRNLHDFRTWIKEMKTKKQKLLKLPKENSKDWDNIFGQVSLAINKKVA